MTRRQVFYGLCLLVGVLLFGGAGILHPLLTGDGAAQLATVAHTLHWRAIHWALLFGLAFMYAGVIGVSLRHNDTPGATPARAAARTGCSSSTCCIRWGSRRNGSPRSCWDSWRTCSVGRFATAGCGLYGLPG